MSAPPRAGPTTEASWNVPLFHVTARASWSRGTRLVRKAAFAGQRKVRAAAAVNRHA